MDYLNTRIRMYEILTSAFCGPQEGSEPAELVERFVLTLQNCCGFSAECCLPLALMKEVDELSRSFAEERDSSTASVGLEVEYTRLFVTDFPSAWAPPYESFYHEGRTMGKAAVGCWTLYAEDGLTLKEGGELPDHIVTQLEYLLFLCLGERKALETGDGELRKALRERQRSFYERHLMTWVPQFCERIRASSKIPYFRVMARFLKNFTVMENKNLNQKKLDPAEEVAHNEAQRA
jgi:TorA maturation chaperone TorD